VKRACGTAFLLGVLFFFPFPNALMAPGYNQLPQLRVPQVREVASELPPPWNHRTVKVLDQSQWFFIESLNTAQLYGSVVRHFFVLLAVKTAGQLL
jgi:hypothetical protein